MTWLVRLLTLALATWWLTVLLLTSALFGPWRRWMAGRRPWLAYLASCSQCLGTEIALVFSLLTVSPFRGPVGWLVQGLAIKATAEVVQAGVGRLTR